MDNFLPVHRTVGAALTCGFLSFAAWAFLGELDITASAQGKLVPTSFVKVAQPSEGGPVKKLLVADGTTVIAGQPLVELDSVFAENDVIAAQNERDRLALQLERIDAELQHKPFKPSVAVQASSVANAALAEYSSRQAALAAALTEANATRDKAVGELASAQALLAKAQKVAPYADKQAHMLEQLRDKGFVAESALIEKLRDRADTALEVKARQAQVAAALSAKRQADAALLRIQADYQRQLAQERTTAQNQYAHAQADFEKKSHQANQLMLRAPVAGTVNGLSIRGAGQVIAAGATVLTIVPTGEPLQFEGWLRNEDIAFAMPGMPIKVKLAAYPFQKYGWLEGDVTWLGADAETPESMKNERGEPLYFRVRAKLNTQGLKESGHPIQLQPGLSAIGDIQLGKRSLFEYLTSPVKKAIMEAARER